MKTKNNANVSRDEHPASATIRETTAETSASEPVITSSPDFKNVYVNYVQTQFSPFDFSLSMGEMIGATPEGKAMVQQKVRVVMTPMETKILLTLLANGIRAYEQQFGTIGIPATLLPPTQGD